MGALAYNVGGFEAYMVCSFCHSVPDWLYPNLTPLRYSLNHNHKWCLYLVFAYLDGGWASQVISSAISATGKGYVLSYGQVWSPLRCW